MTEVAYQNGWPVPAGWKLVPEELIDFLDAKEHHLPVEDRHVLSIMLKAAPVAAQASGKAQDGRPTDDALWDQTLRERDEYHDMADQLAAQIAAITGEEIGEHSSANCPWRNAMLAADDYIADKLRSLCDGHAAQAPAAAGDARDAARYRWLRVRWGRIADTYDGDSNRLVEIREADDRFEGWDVSPESLDAAIDDAMQRASKEGQT